MTGPGLRISAMSDAVAFCLCKQLLSYRVSLAGKSRDVIVDFDTGHASGIFQSMNWFGAPTVGPVGPGQSKVSPTERR